MDTSSDIDFIPYISPWFPGDGKMTRLVEFGNDSTTSSCSKLHPKSSEIPWSVKKHTAPGVAQRTSHFWCSVSSFCWTGVRPQKPHGANVALWSFNVANWKITPFLWELDDGWPESEKDVFQAALMMVVVKDSRWIVGEFYMSYGKIWCKKVRLIKKRIFGKGHQMTCVLQPQRERGGRDKEGERERERERKREKAREREREREWNGEVERKHREM